MSMLDHVPTGEMLAELEDRGVLGRVAVDKIVDHRDIILSQGEVLSGYRADAAQAIGAFMLDNNTIRIEYFSYVLPNAPDMLLMRARAVVVKAERDWK